MCVSIHNIESDDTGGGQGRLSMILGFNKNFILLYFLEKNIIPALKINGSICVRVCMCVQHPSAKTYIIVEAPRLQEEFSLIVIELSEANLGLLWLL